MAKTVLLLGLRPDVVQGAKRELEAPGTTVITGSGPAAPVSRRICPLPLASAPSHVVSAIRVAIAMEPPLPCLAVTRTGR